MSDRCEEKRLNWLVGDTLVAVGFWADHLRLQFDDGTLDLFTDVYYRFEGATTFKHQPHWCDLLCGCIGQVVTRVYLDGDTDLVLDLNSGASIRVSLRQKDRTGECFAALDTGAIQW